MTARITNFQRFLQIIRDGNYPESCIEWWGGKNSHGYGLVTFSIRPGLEGRMYVHRLALELSLGRELHSDLCALHRCDNRICFNPNHLYEGSYSQNCQDSHDRKRRPSRKGSRHPLAKLTEDDVTEMIRMGSQGMLQREIGAVFGVNQQTVSKILRGDRWTHIDKSSRQSPSSAQLNAL